MRIELEGTGADLCRRRHHRRRDSSGMADDAGGGESMAERCALAMDYPQLREDMYSTEQQR
jgi:hypothetical protein